MTGKEACPKEEGLRASLEGRLPPAEQAALAAHVQGCDSCRDLIEGLAPTDGPGRTPAEPPPDDPLIGQTLLGYRVTKELGRGGMGVVYEAMHESVTGLRAAVKVLSPAAADELEAVERLLGEARAASAVPHPGVVKIFNAGRLEGGEPYLIMEFVAGEPLQRRLARERRLPLPEVLRLCAEVAATLAAVHQRGIVHRDLKPGNVMIGPEEDGAPVRVVDFGLAKQAEGPAQTGLTTTNRFVGTVVYASPEQCLGHKALGPPSDVYSLGVMLYELIAGKPPFVGGPMVLIGLHQHKDPPPLSAAAPECPQAVCELVHRMLAKQPEARPTMAEVARLLREIGTSAAPPPPRRPAWLGPAAVGAALFACLGAVGLLRRPRDPRKDPGSGAQTITKTGAQEPATPATGATREPPPPPVIDLAEARVRALDVITEGLRDSRPPLRQQALQALSQYPDDLTRPVTEPMLRDPDWQVQAAAVRALGTLRSEAARRALTTRWDGKDKTIAPRVALAIADALREPAPKEADGRLRRLLYPNNFVVEDRAVAQHAVVLLALAGDANMGRIMRKALDSLPVEERVPLLGRLAQRGDRPAQEALGALLAKEPIEPTGPIEDLKRRGLQLRVAGELSRCNDEAAQGLLRRLAGAAGPLQLLSARLLIEQGEEPSTALFVDHLKKESPLEERILSAEALGAAGRRDVAPALVSLLEERKEHLRLRLGAAEALLLLSRDDPEQRTLDTLLWIERTLSDPRWAVRLQAVGPLGDADPRLAIPPLQRALRDEAPEVRRIAARSLGRTRDRDAVPALRGALSDKEAPVRQEVALAIGAIGRGLLARGEAVDDLRKDVAQRRDQGDTAERLSYAAALDDLGDAMGAGRLIDALRDARPDVRFAAAAYLGERGRKEGAAELRAAAAGRGPRALVAASLLSRLGEAGPGPLEAALGAAEAPLRAAAVGEVAQLPPRAALPLLSRAAADPDPQVRRALVAALGPSLSREAAARPLLRTLAGDADPQVRGHAGAVLARLAPAPAGSPRAKAQEAAAAYLGGDAKKARELSAGRDDELSLRTSGELGCEAKDAAAARAAYAGLRDGASRRHVAALCRRAGIDLGPPKAPAAIVALEAQLRPEDHVDISPPAAVQPAAPPFKSPQPQRPTPPTARPEEKPRAPDSPIINLPDNLDDVLKKKK